MHDLHVMNNREMKYWLVRFAHKVRKQDGKPNPPSTTQQTVAAGLQRFVREYHSADGRLIKFNFFQKDDFQLSLNLMHALKNSRGKILAHTRNKPKL